VNQFQLQIKQFNQEYGEASTQVHNAQQRLDSREHRQRKLAKQIQVRQTELQDMELAMERLLPKIEQAKEQLRTAKEIYRPLRQQWKLLNPKKEHRQ
jgi:peptidoglycan hydrolase CwlO-like protein